MLLAPSKEKLILIIFLKLILIILSGNGIKQTKIPPKSKGGMVYLVCEKMAIQE